MLITVIKNSIPSLLSLPKDLKVAINIVVFAIGMPLSAQASDLVYNNEYFDYLLPEEVAEVCQKIEGYRCPDITILYANSSQHWINTLINSRINQLLPDSEAGYRPLPKPPMLSKSAVKTQLDGFAKSQLNDIPHDSSLHYEFNVQPNYLGHIGDIELFKIDSYIYIGGAHGLGYTEFMMFDSDAKRQLRLDDVLVKGKKPDLEVLTYAAYKNWVHENVDDVKHYENMWPFALTENVMLTHKGLKFTYQPYEIAAYSYGMPELTVPYTELKGVLKDDYLR